MALLAGQGCLGDDTWVGLSNDQLIHEGVGPFKVALVHHLLKKPFLDPTVIVNSEKLSISHFPFLWKVVE